MKKWWGYVCLVASLAALDLPAQTNFALLATDGAWTWYNDPRAVFHNGVLYFGYVRNADGKSVLSAIDQNTGRRTELWSSVLAQKDDHNNPALLVKEDGKLLAIHARHNSDQFFSYRLSTATNPVSPNDWSQEFTNATGAGVTYANPHQLTSESGRIYNFMRNQNFNPTIVTSTDGGQTWSTPQLFIRTGTGSIRPYAKYSSDGVERIDCLYTDGHPRNLTNSLYHLFYRGGAFYRTDGALIKDYAGLPLLHDSGERGAVIYRYSTAETNDPNEHIPTGRAWCWETSYQSNGYPAAVFTVQRDNVMGPSWSDDRIYYYYARWTGTNWQKRFIAHAGRPLYESEDDYAGGICMDPENANIVYISSNAQQPFDLTTTTNVPLRSNARYEIYRGVTSDGGQSFQWQAVTTDSTVDNLRPYMPRHHNGAPAVIWFRGNYTTFTSYSCDIVGLFSARMPQPPQVKIDRPATSLVAHTNLSNWLKLSASVSDDALPQPSDLLWTTPEGPTNAVFSNPTNATTYVRFPESGSYTLRLTANDTVSSAFAETAVLAGSDWSLTNDPTRVLWLKLDESSGATANDSSGENNTGTVVGTGAWIPGGGIVGGALHLDGATAQLVVADSPPLDNTSAFTMAFWFRAAAYPTDSGGLVSKRNNTSDNNAYTTYLKTSDRRIYVDIDSANNRFSSKTLISTGTWYHVALTFDGSQPASQRVQLWINGELDTIASETSMSIPDFNSSVRVGNTHPGAANWLNGSFDDVQFFRRPLAASEIRLLAVRHRTPSVFPGNPPAVMSEVAAPLDGSAEGTPGSSLSTAWEKLDGPGNVSFDAPNALNSSVNFARAGRYWLRLRAEDELAEVADDLAVLVRANTNVFEDWAALHFPSVTNASILSEVADFDADGVANLFEFAFGMDPREQDARPFSENAAGLPHVLIEPFDGTNFLTLRLRQPAGRLGLFYDGKVSSQFASWEGRAQSEINVNNGTATVILRDEVPASGANHRFLKLEITRNPPLFTVE